MKLHGSKNDLIERWKGYADMARRLAEKSKSKKIAQMYLVEARIFDLCCEELLILREEKESK